MSAMEGAQVPFVKPTYKRRGWTKDKIIQELLRLKESGFDFSANALYKKDKPLTSAIRRHFGGGSFSVGYNRAMKAAGIVPGKPVYRRKWTKDKIVSELLKLKRRGFGLSSYVLSKRYTALAAAIRRHFGKGSLSVGYTKAMAAAGLTPTQQRRVWTKEKIISELLELKRSGFDLSRKALSTEHGALAAAIKRHFGEGTFSVGYRRAMAAAGIKGPKDVIQAWVAKLVQLSQRILSIDEYNLLCLYRNLPTQLKRELLSYMEFIKGRL